MTDHTPAAPKPLRPRPRLFAVLLLLMVLWIAFLLILYITTVLPRRNTTTSPAAHVGMAPPAFVPDA